MFRGDNGNNPRMSNRPDFRLEKVAEANFPSEFGLFRIFGFEGYFDDGQRKEECLALRMGDLSGEPPLVRIHSQCLTGDVLHSLRCDCRSQLTAALGRIAREGRGLLIYEHQEGRGIGLMNKLRAYELQDGGRDTVEANEDLGFDADLRNFVMPTAILRTFGLTSVRFMSNNPQKIAALESAGIRVAERVPIQMPVIESTKAYLRTKKKKLGHMLDL